MITCVVNPASANGRTGTRWPELAAAVRRVLGDESFETCFTKGPGQATELTRDALQRGAARIIAAGGDGTFNEVVNGFFVDGAAVNPEARLSLIPAGTGGDLRRTLGLPLEGKDAIEHLGRADRAVDVGKLTYTDHEGRTATRYFINIASFGMGGLVDRYVNQGSKALGAKASFLWGVARAALRYKNQAVRIRIDEGETMDRRVNNVAVANGQYFGGGMQIAPCADMSDGAFDIVVVGDLGTLAMARGLPKLYGGTHIGMDGIEAFRGKRVRAEPGLDEVVLLDVDGEQPGRLPATFELLPAALHLGFATARDAPSPTA